MRAVKATVMRQGRATLPLEVRRHLGLTTGDTVTFLIEEDGVRIVANRYTIETVRSAVAAIPGMSADFDRETEEAMAEEVGRATGATLR
jgi:bifunctional DNA-binding transcriptional regulator/antitoxin component of YhaV-PrlF toxin-antitoxin module